MIDKLYKRIVRFFVETHIARIDFSSEEEAEEFYNWLYPDKSQKRELSMKKIIRICAWTMSVFAVVCLALMLICNQMVVNNAEGKVFADIDSIRYNKVGLLLGTTPQARFDRITNYFFIYRIDAAEQLYKAGKIDQILISGDENSLDGVNETECMRDSLVARGVPASAIILDGKGYRTICSVINANKVYGLKSFTIISQKFHNERAIYQAEHLGLDVENIQAYNAKDPKSRRAYLTTIREYFARVKMFWDLLIDQRTKELGDNIATDFDAVNQDMWYVINHVIGHDEKDTIIGNFTGKGIDTLYVSYDRNQKDEYKPFIIASSNRRIPPIRLYGVIGDPPKLVNEGDLDGNGTSEVGYLPTWDMSQWRVYRVFTFINGQWRYLIRPDHEYMETGEFIRGRYIDLVEPSIRKGWVKVHYQTQGVNETIKDTIVKPDFSPIDD